MHRDVGLTSATSQLLSGENLKSIRRHVLRSVALLITQGLITRLAVGADAPFQHVGTANIRGTSGQGEVPLVPSRFVRVFGPPTDEPWDSESLGAFYFQRIDGEVFVVYFRAYDTPNTAAFRQRFWAKRDEVPLRIGARTRDGVDEFKAWLTAQVR